MPSHYFWYATVDGDLILHPPVTFALVRIVSSPVWDTIEVVAQHKKDKKNNNSSWSITNKHFVYRN